MLGRLSPRAVRAASEKGSAAPTRNENPGWIRSWSEPPTQATWSWWWHRNAQSALVGTDAATPHK